jgi:hypothetical protein
MKVISEMTILKVTEPTNGLTGERISVTGRTTRCTEKESSNMQMAMNMMVTGKTTNEMDMEFMLKLMYQCTRL